MGESYNILGYHKIRAILKNSHDFGMPTDNFFYIINFNLFCDITKSNLWYHYFDTMNSILWYYKVNLWYKKIIYVTK